VKEFSDAMVKLGKGKITDAPVKSQFGFHVIRVDDVRETQLPPLDQVKPQISQQLSQQKLQAFQRGLREKAKIE
jgi:peptidyl-prolyl cis-trans isomerase C